MKINKKKDYNLKEDRQIIKAAERAVKELYCVFRDLNKNFNELSNGIGHLNERFKKDNIRRTG